MTTPTQIELRQWADNYIALWNAGDKEAWLDNWRRVAPGEVRMHDPVGTPEKLGGQQCWSDAWDLFNKVVHFKIADGSLFFNGNEVAWLLENHITHDGATTIGLSIETYRFEEDGSVVIRTYYKVPKRSDDELGRIFQEYLPE
ncbi:MAG: hypothetical protein GY944_20425 [bacterium]|nr:hypothetical protein [bacterium]